MESPTDREIVEALKRDPDEGARLLTRKHEERVTRQLLADYRDLRRMGLLSEHEINEGRDEAVLRIIRYIESYNELLSPLWRWWHRIAKNCISSLFKGKPREEQLGVDIPVPEKIEPLSKKQRWLLRRVDAEIEKLPAMQQAIILLDMAAGEKACAKEVAKRLRTTANSIRVSRHKAHKKLKRALGRLMDGEEDE